MSRIRIVKGKIYEKIGGDLKYYSETDITEIASETYAEQSVKEISHKGDPCKPSAGEIKAKCLVQFRPHDKWSGEFGFDWIRMGDNDTGRRGDKYWYRDIIGRYRDTKGKLFQVYDGGKFKKENAQYNLLLKEFSLFNITWKKDIYVVPILSLMPNYKS